MPPSAHEVTISSDQVHARQVTKIDQLRDVLESLHHDVRDRLTASSRRQIEARNRCTNLQSANLIEGDFVLFRRMNPGGHKLSFQWIGRRRVTRAVPNLVYEVEDLIEGKKEVIHARCMVLYRAFMDMFYAEPALIEVAKQSEKSHEVVKDINGIQEKYGLIKVQIEGTGLPDSFTPHGNCHIRLLRTYLTWLQSTFLLRDKGALRREHAILFQ